MNTTYEYTSFLRNDFILYLEKRKMEVTDNTYRWDQACLQHLDRYIFKSGNNDVNIGIVSECIESKNQYSEHSMRNFVCSIRGFIKYVNTFRNKRYYVPEYRTWSDSYLPHYYTSEEKKTIYAIIDNYEPPKPNHLPWIKVEFPMIVRIMDGCGTRIGEILSLVMQDVELDNGVIVIKDSKNDVQRRVPMSESLSKILRDYCYAMGITNKNNAYLFPGKNKNECLKVKEIGRRFVRILSKAGIRDDDLLDKYSRGPSLYNMRHTFSVDSFHQLRNIGMELDDIVCYLSIYMGHKSLSETMVYLKRYLDAYPDDVDAFYEMADQLAPKEDKWEKWNL